MLQQLLDNGLTTKLGRRLENGHNRMLGSRRTMQLARRFNRLKNHSEHSFRQRLFRSELNDLLSENQESATNPSTSHPPGDDRSLTDGWSIDTSGSLPFLDELIADAQEIIQQRGGVCRGGGDRSFFQQLITDEHIARYPSLLRFATSNEVLVPVMRYMGDIPVLSVSKPLGVRLNESDQKLSPPHHDGYAESQLFHCDYHDSPMVYVIVTLRDVTSRSGPFSFLPASVSRQARQALGYGSKRCPYRITDEQMYNVVDRDALIEFAYPAGSVLFLDSSHCFHYGSRDCEIPRYLMMYAYVSVCRTDFGDLLRRESPEPVLDDSARTRRCSYPIPAEATRLKQLVLDRTIRQFSR